MYVVKKDYAGRISHELLIMILSDTNATETEILEQASTTAEGMLQSMAGVLYDIDPELVKTGSDRNGMLLKYAKDIATYELYQRIDDYQVPEKVIKNYNDAIDTLEKIAQGKVPLNLPLKDGDAGGGTGSGSGEDANTQGRGLLRIGSQTKRTHRP